MIFQKHFILVLVCVNKFMEIFKTKIQKHSGYVTLLALLIVGAIGMSVGVALMLSGVGGLKNSGSYESAHKARALAMTCAEEALEVIRENSSFSGSNNLNLGGNTCNYTVTNTGGENRSIATSATVGTITSKVLVLIDAINPKINIASWQEVADF